jgi:hypothetical protein
MNIETTTTEPTNTESTSAVTAPKPKSQRRPHRSKITNIPEAIRDFLNESIHNHVPYEKIIQSLAEKGHPGISPANITAWTKSGYKLWLQERERFQCLRLTGEDVAKQFRQRDDRLDVIRHKAGIGRKTGPNELARQSVKDAFNLSDSWFNKPETQQQQHSA